MTKSETPLSSNRPYLLRAIYDWLIDNNLTPQILVDATQANVQVPKQHVKDGQILLNIGVGAINNLAMDNHQVSFSARFSGSPMLINAPIPSILAIFARENGQGMAFPDEAQMDQALIDEIAQPTGIKESDDVPVSSEIDPNDTDIIVEDATDDTSEDSSEEKPKRAKPTLKIVK